MFNVTVDALPGDAVARAPFVEETGRIWRSLTSDGRVSYFLSWGWIESWLLSLPPDASISFVRVEREGLTPAAFFLGRRRIRRRGCFRAGALFLNTTGDPSLDTLCLEYNGIPASPGVDIPLNVLFDRIDIDWEEIQMPALSGDAFPGDRLNTIGEPYRLVVDRRGRSLYVELETVRVSGDYLSLLSANARAQVRQSLRRCGKHGTVSVRQAASLEEARGMFRELTEFHRRSWSRRKEQGAFSGSYMRHFHETLIEKRFDSREIQLLRVTAGDVTLGYLYNFVYDDRVLFYQGGLNSEIEAHCRPGIVCHVMAIEHNAALGHKEYDFLAGDARYKRSLSTASRELVWCRVQKPLMRFRVEEMLVRAKRGLSTAPHPSPLPRGERE